MTSLTAVQNERVDSILLCIPAAHTINFYCACQLRMAGMVGAVGKISAFRPQGPQFDPRLCRDLN